MSTLDTRVDRPRPGTDTFDEFSDAYTHTLDEVLHRPAFRNAPRGAQSRELLNVSFALRDPRKRVIWSPARRTNIVFNFAEALWYLSGSDDLEHIAYYAQSIRRYSMDGKRLTGTAYGPKLFRHGPQSVDQWSMVLDTLRSDPDSKRAVMQIFSPEEYLVHENIDVSCTMSLQFLLRDGALHAITHMRANDAYRGMVSDVFSFTLIHEMMAAQLARPLGHYYHHVGSFHLYETDEPAARAVLDEARAGVPVQQTPPQTPAMPRRDNWPDVKTVLELERPLRMNAISLSSNDLERTAVDPFWQQVLALFETYRSITHENRMSRDALAFLCPGYRDLVVARWPQAARGAACSSTR